MAFRILIVDDEKDTVETLKSILLKKGYEISVAYDGEEALAKIKEDNPDIILLDLVMPKLSGYDTLKQIREKYKDKWRPVIIISARTELESVQNCYNLEADHYLTKPCSVDNILRGIETMIALMRVRIQ